MGRKKCFIARGYQGIRVYDYTPRYCVLTKTWTSYYMIGGMCVPPQLRRMWKLALKGLLGKAAIAEVCGETWVPYITRECPTLHYTHTHTDSCWRCHGAGIVRRLMTPDDLKKHSAGTSK